MKKLLSRASCTIHARVCADAADAEESLCSHAWRHRRDHRFWAIWTLVFCPAHCRESYLWHHYRKFGSK